jgi:hypothetical protein
MDLNHGLFPLTKMRKVMEGGEDTENGIIGTYLLFRSDDASPCTLHGSVNFATVRAVHILSAAKATS